MALLASMCAGSASAVVEQPFDVRFSANDTGAIWVTGDTLMTCPAADATCAAAQQGTATGAALSNNAYSMRYVDVDGDPATFDSSTSTYAPPAGSSVLFAGLYWGGRVTSGGGGGAAAVSAASRGSVLLRVPGSPGGAYVPLTGAVADSTAVPGAYTGFADVTSSVQAAGAGQYSVANVQAGTGLDRYAGWSLVVAYRSDSQPLRNLIVFDGLAAIQQGDPPLSLTVNGFTTPRTGPVRTAVGLVAYEGDRGSAGDRLQLNGTPLSDAANPANNVFNSSISAEGVDTGAARTPGFVNQLGFDADRIVTTNLIANGATSVTLHLSTTLDQYLTQMVSLTTDLSAPRLAVAKSVVNVTRGGSDGAAGSPGDLLRYTVSVTNQGDDEADDVAVTDALPAGTVPGSSGSAWGSPAPLGTLAPGATASVTYEAVIAGGAADGAVVVNSASAVGRGATAGLLVNGTSNAVSTLVQAPAPAPAPVVVPPVVPPPLAPPPPPPISIETSVTPSAPVAGEPAVVRTVLENVTGRPIDDVVVTVSVPGARVLSVSVGGQRCSVGDDAASASGGSVATCRIGTLDPGERATVRVRVEPRRAGTVLRPVVTVRGAGIETQRVVVRGVGRVKRPAGLHVTKRASTRRARPGQVVSYRIVVRSVGGMAARGVRLCDVPGVGVRLLSVGGRLVPGERTCWSVRGLLKPGASRSFEVAARVGNGFVNGATVTNAARASAANVAGLGAVSRARVEVAPLSLTVCGSAVSAASAAPRARAAC
ncbi:DUF11 domain-containing protein [Conexibacter sp. CPCC 206217]|uniref:DUF11 domain-containing protein n=1 Tax=Conexibacter sp. CPCC 206217 TaxID=3064574 RepID=UPI002719D018|nr:DUF11 domain-containing protein [Conexibacter sp. CPCC 206217]MDO8209118.1 DUF11 domain-containing protein [Conexibacter sp. CPCC 206217]